MENVTATVALFMVQGGSISHALAGLSGEGGRPRCLGRPSGAALRNLMSPWLRAVGIPGVR